MRQSELVLACSASPLSEIPSITRPVQDSSRETRLCFAMCILMPEAQGSVLACKCGGSQVEQGTSSCPFSAAAAATNERSRTFGYD